MCGILPAQHMDVEQYNDHRIKGGSCRGNIKYYTHIQGHSTAVQVYVYCMYNSPSPIPWSISVMNFFSANGAVSLVNSWQFSSMTCIRQRRATAWMTVRLPTPGGPWIRTEGQRCGLVELNNNNKMITTN